VRPNHSDELLATSKGGIRGVYDGHSVLMVLKEIYGVNSGGILTALAKLVGLFVVRIKPVCVMVFSVEVSAIVSHVEHLYESGMEELQIST